MKLTIVTLCDDNHREIADATASTFEKFSQKSGINFIRHTSKIDPTLHVFWNKFPLVLRELPINDWVMWVDADIMVINYDYDLVGLIKSFRDKNFLVSTDSNGLCTGAFFLRNCSWSYEFLRTLLFLGELFDEKSMTYNEGKLNVFSDQNPVKVLVENWKSVKECTGFIPESEIMGATSKFNPKAFAYHFWANNGDKKRILSIISNLKKTNEKNTDNGVATLG